MIPMAIFIGALLGMALGKLVNKLETACNQLEEICDTLDTLDFSWRMPEPTKEADNGEDA